MSRALITEDYLTDIADAIRAKNGSSDTYTPPQMATAIAAIPTGGDVDVEALSVTANGTYTAPTGKAYSPVAVNVSGGGAWNIPLCRNADFTSPINSRGKSSYINEKSLDGWTCTNTTKCDIESNAIRITPVGGNTNMYQQIKAAFTGAMDGQYMTISVMTDTAAASSTFQLNASNVRQGQVTIGNLTFWCNRDSSTVVACGFTVTSAETNGIVIRAAKIEFGSTQTLYRQSGSGYEILQNQDNSIEAILGTNMIANWS